MIGRKRPTPFVDRVITRSGRVTTEGAHMPKYAALLYGESTDDWEPEPDEMAAIMAEYAEFGEWAGRRILAGEALQGPETATTIHVEGGKGGNLVTTDGPFAETKEVLGGFYIFEASDLEDAIKTAARIPGAWHGRIEVRPVWEIPDA